MRTSPEIPKWVKNFQELIRWIADTWHDGKLLPIAKRLGISSSSPYFWRDGTTRAPETDTVMLIAESYGLDLKRVLECVRNSGRAPVFPR